MKHQQGMTFLGMIFTMIVVVMAGVTVMRIVPVYIQHYSLLKSVRALQELPPSDFTGNPAIDVRTLRSKLMNQLYVNSIDDIKSETIKIVPESAGIYSIKIDYEVRRTLIKNMSLLFDFKINEEIRIAKP